MDQLRPSEPTDYTNIQSLSNTTTNSQDITNLVMPKNGQNNGTETKTREFVVGDMKEEPSKIKIDFFSGDKPNDFVKAQTEQAKPDIQTNGAQYINPVMGSSVNGMPQNMAKTKEELRGSISTLIAIIDYGMSWLGLILAGEGTQSQFTADTQQKKLLETALVDYMWEKQAKLSPGVALFLAILGAYGFMLMGAGKKRFDLMRKKKASAPLKPKAELEQEKNKINDLVKDTKQTPIFYDEIIKHPAVQQPNIPNYIADKDGTLIEQPPAKSTWYSPDPTIVAKNKKELELYLAKGIFPGFKKNERSQKVRRMTYQEDGRPRFAGRATRRGKIK